jgi:arsenite-transporting ATPase
LADAFDRPLGGEPTPVTERLCGQQIDAQERMEESWSEIKAYLMQVFDWAGVDGIEAEELAVFPGLDEIFSLTDIKTFVRSGDWDVVVVDCAPTAETIRLLSLPDILSWYMDRVFPMGRQVTRLVGPVLSRVTSVPVAGDHVLGATERFYDRLAGVKELLTDPEHSSVRLVVNPEKMVIAEARRTFTYLSLFGYPVDAVVANRLLPASVNDPWFDQWKVAQAAHLEEIETGFSPVPTLRAHLDEKEVVGVDRLRRFGDRLYGEADPAVVLHRERPLRIESREGDYVLELELPFADQGDLELGRRHDELLVRVGPYRRALLLPDTLRGRNVVNATLSGGTLRVVFAGQTGSS